MNIGVVGLEKTILTGIQRFRFNSVFEHRLQAIVNEHVLRLQRNTQRKTIYAYDIEMFALQTVQNDRTYICTLS